MKIFISGPMTGLPEYNRESFEKAAEGIRQAGHEPLNPWNPELAYADPPLSWYECMMRSLRLLGEADGIVALPDSENSVGSNIEQLMARKMGLIQYEFHLVLYHIIS